MPLDEINSFVLFLSSIGADWDCNNPEVQYPFFHAFILTVFFRLGIIYVLQQMNSKFVDS